MNKRFFTTLKQCMHTHKQTPVRVVDNVYSIERPYFGPRTAQQTQSLIVHNTLLRVGYLLFLVVYTVTVLHWLDFVAKIDRRVRAGAARLLRPALAVLGAATAAIYVVYFAFLPRAGVPGSAYGAVDTAMLAYMSLCFLLCAVALLGTALALHRAVRRTPARRLAHYARRVLALAAAGSALLVLRTVWTVVLAVRDGGKAATGWPPALLVCFQLVELLPLTVLAALMWPAPSKRRLVRRALNGRPDVSVAASADAGAADAAAAAAIATGVDSALYDALIAQPLPSPLASPSPSPSPSPSLGAGTIN